jgi:16S rRNA processing protein RimM
VSLVNIGRLGRPHGLNGELAFSGASLQPAELLNLREFTWRGARGESRTLRLKAARSAVPRMLVQFEGIGSRASASALVNGTLWVDRAQLPDPGPGMAYTFQLMGLEVRDESGRVLGRLEDIVSSGAHPIYVVQGEREWLIPAVESVLRRVDLEAGVITVALPAGLEDI